MREKLPVVVREKTADILFVRIPSPLTVQWFLLLLSTLSQSLLLISLCHFYMEKSKKKSSVLRYAQQDYGFCTSHPSSSHAQRTLSQSSSSSVQHSSSPSQASTPPRTIVAFADVVNFNRGAKVRVKNRNKGMQSTPLTIPPSSSPNSCGKNVESSVTTRPRHVLSPESGSLGSFPGIGNPSPGLKVRVATPPPPLVIDKASSGSHRPSSLDHPTGTTIPLSPSLVHFFYYTASTPWVFNNWNIKCKASTWCLNSRYSLQLLSQTCSLFCYHKNPKIITT